ncbi:MAG: trigger factor [Candidatus Hydrogenedentes bacterium]|nr:trigger factor [Candidatus Hydrogenedentota bacterium]
MSEENETKEEGSKEDGSTAVAEESHDEDRDHGEEDFEFAEDPTFDIDYKGECAYEVKVTVPVANEKKQAGQMFDELKSDAEIPGFRRGRAPLKLVENKFSKVVKGEVRAKLVGAAFQKLVKDEDLQPAGFPDIEGLDEEGKRAADEPLAFTLKFDVSPRVELGKYRGIEVERPFVLVDDDDVNEAVNDMLDRHAVFEELKEGTAEEGDQVIIDFKGRTDGEEFSGGSAENYPYILGSKRFFPEFEEALKGCSPDSEINCTVTFPEDYFAEELRTKKAKFEIKVNELKRKKLPELSKEFAEEAGYEGVKDLKTKLKEQLEQAGKERSKVITESRALEGVVEASTFEISPKLIDTVAGRQQEQEVRQLISKGLPREEFDKQLEILVEKSKESAARNIKTIVVLNEIGEAEGIEVSEEDLDKEAEIISKSIGAEVDMVAGYIKEEGQRDSYLDRIYRMKALAVIMDNATITDKELTRDELEETEGTSAQGEE